MATNDGLGKFQRSLEEVNGLHKGSKCLFRELQEGSMVVSARFQGSGDFREIKGDYIIALEGLQRGVPKRSPPLRAFHMVCFCFLY